MLEDASGKYLPTERANKAVNLYRKYQADRIVAEINQGGQMVEATIRTVDKNVAYRGVTAKRGKMLRAEPISALYEQYKCHHVGAFPELKDQMRCFSGGGDSPDRLDAAVYALPDLMCGFQAQPVSYAMPVVVSVPRQNPFGELGPNPFSESSPNADQARAYGDPRNAGFSRRGF